MQAVSSLHFKFVVFSDGEKFKTIRSKLQTLNFELIFTL